MAGAKGRLLGGAAVGRDGQARTLADGGALGHEGAFAHYRAAHAVADLRGVHVELGEGAAQRVAMHPQLGGGLALVALVLREYLEDVAFLELPHGIRVGNTGTVHLGDQGVQFALQGSTSLTIYRKMIPYFRPLNAD